MATTPKPPTKVNKEGKKLYLSPGGNSYTTKDPGRTTAIITPISGENAGQRVSVKADGTKTVTPPKTGITTSDDAANRNKAANETLAGISPASQGKTVENPLTAMYKRLSDLQTQLTAAKEKEKVAQETQANAETKAKLDATPSAEEAPATGSTDLNAAADAISGKGTTENIQDPVIRALTDKTIANTGIITNQMNTLAQYREQFNEYTQQDIDSIARTAERSVQRQIEENERTANAMRFAGVLGGRAQFSPVPEQSIIHEVIQDGLDKVEVINEKKNTAIREARKAEAEFNIDAFEQQSDLAKEYNNEIESTISAMNAQVRQVEKDDRDRVTFRQSQEERNSIILAEQLIDSTPEKIMQTALANGIDAGLLMKAVNDAKFEKQSQELEIASKEENILSSKSSRYLDQQRFDREGEKEKKSDIPEDVEQGFRSVAQLSKNESEQIWTDITDFGLNGDTVAMWLDSGEITKAQAKAIVSAHEQSQRGIKEGDEGAMKPTETETALYKFVDTWKSKANKESEEDISNLITGQSFFKKN